MADSTLASVPEDSAAPASTSGLPAAAKSAAEQAVKAAIAETATEEGEIAEDAGSKGSSNGIKTVFSDPANFNVVHPLYSKWILWFDNASKQNKAKDWNEQLQEVMAFETVEEFWGLYNKYDLPRGSGRLRSWPKKADFRCSLTLLS
jgi:translation initiation factor 4E